MNWNEVRARGLDLLAAQMIPTVERIAVELLIRNGEKLRGKADLALDLVMGEYKKFTKNTPLGATDMDDVILRGLAEKALAQAWVEIDERVKQAARDVKAALPAPTAPPATAGTVTDPIDVSKWQKGPQPGPPVTVGPPAAGTTAPPPMERED